jgi:ABC-2 type transport system ATP-binding protein
VSKLSGGQRQRLALACALVGEPEILFLDEPTTGLDPRGRNQVWELVRRIAAEGTTVLLTTQYLDEADRLAERMAVIDHGRVIAEGTSRELKASVGSNALHVRLANAQQQKSAEAVIARAVGDRVLPSEEAGMVSARLDDTAQAAGVLAALTSERIDIAEISVGRPSLDEVFLALTGRPAEDGETAVKNAD